MKTKAYRQLDKLNSNFKIKVEKFLTEVNRVDQVIFIAESWRNQERQNELISLWLSQVKHSNHQDWLAIDIWFFWKELYPSDINKWKYIASVAKKYWIDWWYDLWQWDKPHFQDNWIPIIQVNHHTMSKYKEIMENKLKILNLTPIFNSHEWETPLSEQDTKCLIEIALAEVRKK